MDEPDPTTSWSVDPPRPPSPSPAEPAGEGPPRQWTVPAPSAPPSSSPWGATAPLPVAPPVAPPPAHLPPDGPPGGYGPPGYGPAGHGLPGYGPPGGHGSPGYGAPGYGPAGYGPPAYGPPAYGPPPGAPAPGPSGSGRGVWVAFGLASFAVVAALAFLLVALVVTAADDGSDDTASPTATASEGPTTTLPGGRLAPEPAIPTRDGPHEFFNVEPDGDPVAWDPCDPIPYVVNSTRAPEGAMEILDEAITRVEQATGLVFVDEGATDEMAPVGEQVRPDSDPGRYGEGWSPVLISWTDAMADPELDGAAGLALPSWVEAASGERVYVTGYVEMAGDYAAGLISRGGRDDVLGIMMHELGHLVGLGHVTPSDEVMTDDPNSTPSQWGAGDLVGLSAVGRGECEPDV